MVWFDYDLVDFDALYGLEANPWNSHQSSPDPGLVRVRPNKAHCFAYDAVRSEQHGATLYYTSYTTQFYHENLGLSL